MSQNPEKKPEGFTPNAASPSERIPHLATELSSPSSPDNNAFGTTSSGGIPSQPPSPGILTVTLSSARGLSIDETDRYISFDEPDVRKRWLVYAILECEKTHIFSEAVNYTRRRSGNNCTWWPGATNSWTDRNSTFKFDVSAPSELTMHIFEKRFHIATGNQVKSLGTIKLYPFVETWVPGAQSVNIQGGTGTVELDVAYLEKKVPPLEDSNVWTVRQEVNFGGLVRVEKRDTDRAFAMSTISTSDPVLEDKTLHHRRYPSLIEHPFIAPLEFVFKSTEGLRLLSPLASGGHVFSDLQREGHLEVDRARIHVAELTSALEYLHTKHIILAGLKPENIALDALGHISLCSPGLFGLLDREQGDRIVPGKPEIPAPELILGQEVSRAVDWWSLGVILHELLTGVPPFYHKDVEEQRHQITDQTLQLPEGLPIAARDILTKLLDKNPARRLGSKGASEIKTHEFFRNMDWLVLMQRTNDPIFKPGQAATVFRVEPDKPKDTMLYHETGMQRVSGGVVEKEIKWDVFGMKFWVPVEDNDKKSTPDETPSRVGNDGGWELVWEPTSQAFHFNNQRTGEKRPIRRDLQPADTAPTDNITQTAQVNHDQALQDALPSQSQKQDVLRDALEDGYSNRVVQQILEYGVDLDDAIIVHVTQDDSGNFPPALSGICRTWFTPLEWVVDNDNIELAELFLGRGADANFSTFPRNGPALIKAVKNRSSKLIEVLLPRTNRINSTRALCHAVEHQDISTVNNLLTSGIPPDFEEAYPQSPNALHSSGFDCILVPLNQGPRLMAQDFTSPLVRAVRLGSTSLVQLLLANGADANAAYHVLDIPNRCKPWEEPMAQIYYTCGRAAQLAMELGHLEIVQLLLDAGADVSLPPPFWNVPDHTCPLIPRSVHLQVTAGLGRMVAERRNLNAPQSSC